MPIPPKFMPGRVPSILNTWYICAFSNELGRTALARTIAGKPLVMYRTESGKPIVLEDRCAHRATALSLGSIVGDSIQCAYHGIRYGEGGKCTLIPSQTSIPTNMAVAHYCVEEIWEFVWIWMGDPALADVKQIPDHREFGILDPAFVKTGHHFKQIRGNYQLLHENLLDTSHISFLHKGYIDSGAVASAEPTVTVQGNRVTIARTLEEVATGGFAYFFEFEEGERIQRYLATDVYAPNLSIVINTFTSLDKPDRPVRHWYAPFAITPCTDQSAFLFATICKNWGGEMDDAFHANAMTILDQDRMAIESAQLSWDKMGADTPDVSVRVDEAALRFRRVMTNLVQASMERQPSTC